jgi:hypothetical protein
MATLPEKAPQWWDREFDSAGRPLRTDVRAAAQEIWDHARVRTARELGDDSEAAEILEKCVEAACRYLNSKSVPLFSINTPALLTAVFRRQLERKLSQARRIESIGEIEELNEIPAVANWWEEVDRWLDLLKYYRYLSPRGCRILLLRLARRSWKYIADSLGISVSTAQNSFWREIRQVRLKLKMNPTHHR